MTLNEDDLMLWNYAHIRVVDIRHYWLSAGEKLHSYRLPSSVFVHIVSGLASIRMDGKQYVAERFHILHSGRGSLLEIEWVNEELEYYFIYYKASLPMLTAPSVRRKFESQSPFQKQYQFIPLSPSVLLNQIREMHKKWQQPSMLERVGVKASFYQFIYELERQIEESGLVTAHPDLVEQAINYIDEYYNQSITLASVAEHLNYSVPYVAKQFKRKTGYSLIDFLIMTRMEKAKYLLLHSESSLQDIAASVGYTDFSYFIRIFKKTMGVTPGMFRTQTKEKRKGADRPIFKLGLSNAGLSRPRYIDNEYDNHYQYNYNGKGDLQMYRNTKVSMAATLFLCLSLLLSACTTGSGTANMNRNTTNSAQSQISNSDAKADSAVPSSTRLYTDIQQHQVDIPSNPQRIVLQGNQLGDLLALGIHPIGIDHRFIKGSVYEDQVNTSIQDIGFPINLETVLGLEPDLTMLGYVLDKQYEEVSKISPTVVFNQDDPLATRLPIIGDIVGKKAEAEQLIANYNTKAEQMWSTLRQEGKIQDGETAVVLIYYWNKTMYLMKSGGLARLLYQPQGYGMSDKVKEIQPPEGMPYIEISEELMHDTLIGDRLFVLYPANDDADKAFNELLETPLWKTLPAVKNDKVTFIETKWNYEDMLTSDMLLDEFPKLLTQ